MSAIRCLIDGPCAGSRNMAVDEVLLTSAIERQQATVRLYQWNVPTVSLGHFQSPDDPVLSERFAELPKVRRLSGGGAILHDAEVTYSCTIPASHPFTREPTQLYVVVHEVIIEVLREFGIDSRMRGSPLNEPEPFLCFGRGDPRDIVIGTHKIVGSAQRRRTGAILQHGALLLKSSRYAPEFPGLEELTGKELSRDELSAQLSRRIQSALSFSGLPAESGLEHLSSDEELLVQEWEQGRYHSLA